jgi:type IV secretory pathway VirB6-like protein
MSAKDILIPLVMVGITIILNAIINTKIKFAPTAAHAITDIKKILLNAAFWLVQLYFVWSLVSEFVSDAPLTKRSLFVILICSIGLFHSYLMYWLNRVIHLFEKMTVVTNHLLDCINSHTESINSHTESIKSITEAIKPAQPNKSLQPTATTPTISHG